MDLAEIIISGNQQEEQEIDLLNKPAEALDQHRKNWPLNQKVADDKLVTPDGSDRIRLRRVGDKLTAMGFSVSGAERSNSVSGAQISFSGYFDRSGEIGSPGVTLDAKVDDRDTKAIIQEALQTEGFNFIINLDERLVHLRPDSRNQDGVRYAEAGGGDSRNGYGWRRRNPDEPLSPEELLRWKAILPDINDWQIHSWRDQGLEAADVKQWVDAGIHQSYEVQNWMRLPQTPDQAKQWRDAGISVSFAGDWITNGLSPADAQDWALIGLPDYDQVKEWKQIGFGASQAEDWVSIPGVTVPRQVAFLIDNKFTGKDAQQLHKAGIRRENLEKIEKWVANYKIELPEAVEWAKLGRDFIGPGKRGRWHKAGFTPETVKVWQAALGKQNISVDEVKALKVSGYDPEAAQEWIAVHPRLARSEISAAWIEAGLTPEQAEKWIELHEDYVDYHLVAEWLEAGLAPADAKPWAEAAEKHGASSLLQRSRVEEWLNADPRCQNPELTAKLSRLTSPSALPELAELLS